MLDYIFSVYHIFKTLKMKLKFWYADKEKKP